jgi:hypothetical protein
VPFLLTGNINKVYGYGEVIDLEEENIKVTASPIRVVEKVGKGFQKPLDEYKDKPKVKNLSVLGLDCIDDDFYQKESIYFRALPCT